MSGFALHVGATVLCPHGGQVQEIPTSPRVFFSKQPAATLADQYMVAGCPFTTGGNPLPCVTVQWVAPAVRCFVNKQPLVTNLSTGLCVSAVPQGAPIASAFQTRVRAT